MRIEIWSDVVCPWCYIGKRRLERALGQFEHAADVEITWRSFQLNPDTPPGTAVPTLDYLARRFGPQATAMTTRVRRLRRAVRRDVPARAADRLRGRGRFRPLGPAH
jgi:predicted DsbA family dithiol-disulfide isomerase